MAVLGVAACRASKGRAGRALAIFKGVLKSLAIRACQLFPGGPEEWRRGGLCSLEDLTGPQVLVEDQKLKAYFVTSVILPGV
jgi:hypothetical protein